MDTFERKEQPDVVDLATEGSGMPSPSLETTAASSDSLAALPAEPTVFTVLAGHIRTRSPAHLWIATAIGIIDSVALAMARPGLWWVSTAFGGAAAYAVWGLADRSLTNRAVTNTDDPGATSESRSWAPLALRGVRVLALAVGLAAVLATVAGFLGTALGRAGPPG